METSQPQDQPLQDQPSRAVQIRDRIRERTAQRYDRLFRHTFIRLAQIAALLRAWMTAEERDRLDWKTLSPLPADFVDESLRRTQADLLFEVRHVVAGADGKAAKWTCVLVEHQSSPDRDMDLRLHQYSGRVIAAARRRAAEGEPDPEILPVLFHHGERPWPYPQTLKPAEDESSSRRRLGPRFEYLLIDLAAGTPADIVGAPLGRLVQLLFYATTGPKKHRGEAVDMLPSAVTATLQAGHELRELDPLFVYLQDSKEDIVTKTVLQALDAYEDQEPAREFISMRERLWVQGCEKGRAEERVAVVAGFLRAGADWDLIQAATGLDESGFKALEKRVEAQ